jgi:hypothetical protein
MAKSTRGTVGRVRRNIESIILPTLHTSMRLSVENCEKSYDEIAQSIQYHTLKAICYRNEAVCSIRNAECDWIEMFVTPFMNPLAASWDCVFHKGMQKLKRASIDNAIKEFGDRCIKIEELLQLISPNAANIFSESHPHRRSILERQIQVIWRNTQAQLKELYSKINSLVVERIKPAYGASSGGSSKH